MSDLLLVQSIGAPPDRYGPWLELSQPKHEVYAFGHGADYECFVGLKPGSPHPAWNRIPLILEAFERGYRKVVWLDADSLVVDLWRDIFAETDDVAPLQMTRVLDSHVEMPWGEPGWDAYNDGVLVVNKCATAIGALEYVWANRASPLLPHHHAGLWELNWLLDFVFAEPAAVKLLDVRWNWMPFRENLHCEDGAAICSWHGMPHAERWAAFRAKFAEVYLP